MRHFNHLLTVAIFGILGSQFANAETWMASCNNKTFIFDNTQRVATIFTNNSDGNTKMEEYPITLSFDDALYAEENGVYEYILDKKKNQVIHRYTNPWGGKITDTVICDTQIYLK